MKLLRCLLCKMRFFSDAEPSPACCPRCANSDKGRETQQRYEAQESARRDRNQGGA